MINEFFANTYPYAFLLFFIFGVFWIEIENDIKLEKCTGIKKAWYASISIFGLLFGIYIISVGLWLIYWYTDSINGYKEMQEYYERESIEGYSHWFWLWTYCGPFISLLIGSAMITYMVGYLRKLKVILNSREEE